MRQYMLFNLHLIGGYHKENQIYVCYGRSPQDIRQLQQNNVSITHRCLAKSEETVEQSEYKIDIAPANISL